MTYKAVNGEIEIEERPDAECSVCHKTTDCQPFGKDGADICLACCQQDPELFAAAQQKIMQELMQASEEAAAQRTSN